jgi:hypothetical protein
MLGYAIYKGRSEITSELFKNRGSLQDSFYKKYVLSGSEIDL